MKGLSLVEQKKAGFYLETAGGGGEGDASRVLAFHRVPPRYNSSFVRNSAVFEISIIHTHTLAYFSYVHEKISNTSVSLMCGYVRLNEV